MKLLWNLFSSTTLTLVLAILICIDAVWGSLLTVNNPAFYQALDSAILLPALIEMGSANISYTLWIYILIILIALFAVNTFVCTVDRLYSIMRSGSPWQSILPHIVHIGFLIALIGHLLGSSYGFKSPENFIMKGDSVPVPMTDGLSVRLDDVDVETSPDTREITGLKSFVTLFDEGREVLSGDIEINGPLIYKGIAFYHMSHGQMPMGLILRIDGTIKKLPFDSAFTASKGKGFKLGTIFPDFARDSSGNPYSRSGEFRNPYQEIISTGGVRGYLNISRPGEVVNIEGVEMKLEDYMLKEYAVLGINKDPGIWFIIAGSSILTIGIILIFIFRGARAELVRKPQESII